MKTCSKEYGDKKQKFFKKVHILSKELKRFNVYYLPIHPNIKALITVPDFVKDSIVQRYKEVTIKEAKAILKALKSKKITGQDIKSWL